MKTVITFLAASALTALWLWIMQEKNAAKIRASNYWPLAYLGSLYCAGCAISLWFEFFNR